MNDLAALVATVYVIGVVMMIDILWMAVGHDLTRSWGTRTLIVLFGVCWPSTLLVAGIAATPRGQEWLEKLTNDTKDDK